MTAGTEFAAAVNQQKKGGGTRMNLTEKELERYRQKAVALNLEGQYYILHNDLDYIDQHCNGIGPEKWPSGIRAAIDKLHPSALLASMIHDLWWQDCADQGELDLQEFRWSNRAFEENAVKLANDYYGWYNPLRYVARHEARKFRKLLDWFGWPNFAGLAGKSGK